MPIHPPFENGGFLGDFYKYDEDESVFQTSEKRRGKILLVVMWLNRQKTIHQQFNRRDEILNLLGTRAKQGDNQHSGSELNSRPKTTEDIAQEIGISKRTAQRVGT